MDRAEITCNGRYATVTTGQRYATISAQIGLRSVSGPSAAHLVAFLLFQSPRTDS